MNRHTLLLLSFLAFFGCSSESAESHDLVATTGQIHDALVRLTEGTPLRSKVLCGPGIDPHSYRASSGDVSAMTGAKLIIRNGFHLEAKLDKLLGGDGRFADKTWTMAGAFPEKDRIDWKEDGKVDPNAPYDPHIWNHLQGWSVCVKALAAQLGEKFPEQREAIDKNLASYSKEIGEAHSWALGLLASLPEGRRFLVSGHDAFNYFAKAYGLETIAVLGIGNDPEPDIGSIREVSQWICEYRVPVIFLESITNPKIAEALQEACKARDWKVDIAKSRLYSDDLAAEPPANTFLGAFRWNVKAVHGALKP